MYNMFQKYNLVIHKCKGYIPFVVIKYLSIPCAVQYIPVAYLLYT